MTTQTRRRIASKTIILPPALAFFAVTDKPENKFDPANLNWSIKLVWSGEGRAAVEKELGPLLPEALEIKKAEQIEEAIAKKDKIKENLANAMEYETPWREVMNRETAEPTGEIEMVLKRPAMRTQRGSDVKVPNSKPLVVDAMTNVILRPIPNRALVRVKMATWPVYFPKDNKAGIKRLLESIQVLAMPEARRPDASGFEAQNDGWTDDGDDHAPQTGGQSPVAAGADY